MSLIRDMQETKKIIAATEQQKNSIFGWFRRKK
ncbi:DUF3967 domain-containing protein [Bacillus sp. S13(2024)]